MRLAFVPRGGLFGAGPFALLPFFVDRAGFSSASVPLPTARLMATAVTSVLAARVPAAWPLPRPYLTDSLHDAAHTLDDVENASSALRHRVWREANISG